MGCDEVSPYLVDTHVLVWLMQDNARLSEPAKAAIRQASNEGCLIVSAITPWEIGLLVSKKRLFFESDLQVWIDEALHSPGVSLLPLLPSIAVESTRLPWEMHPDPADRILVASARHLGATLITADQLLLGYGARGYLRCLAAE